MKRAPEVEEGGGVSSAIKHSLGDGRSWVLEGRLPLRMQLTPEEMEELSAMRPEEQDTIRLFGHDQLCPRYNKSYGVNYRFSGVDHPSEEMPPLLQRLLDYANEDCRVLLSEASYKGRKFNAAFVNWYLDGKQSIGWHSDNETQLYTTAKGETMVYSLSFGETRLFRMRERPVKGQKEKYPPRAFTLSDGALLVMGGRCQKDWQHAVPRTLRANLGERINVTFRIFK
jgi:alkylated DNA repair dioxygenase AlkB